MDIILALLKLTLIHLFYNEVSSSLISVASLGVALLYPLSPTKIS